MNLLGGAERQELRGKVDALNASQAVIEFAMDGTILQANNNFLNALGYTLDEIKGKKHGIFVEPAYKESPDYAAFWAKLNRGESDVAQYKRLGKGGREVWIEASYNPIRDGNGKVVKVVKFAIDVSRQKQELSDLQSLVAALNRSQAVISFGMDGTILDANDNFLTALGYSLPEIKGKHHSMFVDAAYAHSAEYKDFWRKLNAGEFQAGQFKRTGKGGREIWIEASYNPILDLNGKPFKVVKFATDITRQIELLNDLKSLIDVNFGEIDLATGQAAARSATAAQAAETTSSNVQMVASAAEELAASIAEISSSMTKSRQASDAAFEQTAAAGGATQRLADATSAMSGIVALINDIASQINLLALNATIEAARAGEAGRGFAVVANEVKNLASQATKATEQISGEIAGVQSVSDEVVGALTTIRKSIETVQEYVSTTASAVEEQSAVTRSMSGNMQQAATAVTLEIGRASCRERV